jgi:ATP/maltotriose-dependent transcriptional regulator MalT
VLVLDDCHEVPRDAPLHALIVEAAREMPQGNNLVLVGRGEPPAAYIRLLANRTLAVLDPRELQLTREETRAVARRISADEPVLEALHRECGGWAAGVAIALERLRRNLVQPQNLRGEIRQALFDYFAGEVFDRTSEEERHILVATALLPCMSAQLAQEVSGSSSAPALVHRLASGQLFTSRTTGNPASCEYTPLFREFLLSRIDDTLARPEFIDVAARAAAILERCGELDASMALRAKTRDWDSMLRLICTHGMRVLGQERAKTVRKWVATFPAEVAADSPWLTYWSGAAAISETPVEIGRASCRERV